MAPAVPENKCLYCGREKALIEEKWVATCRCPNVTIKWNLTNGLSEEAEAWLERSMIDRPDQPSL